MSREEIKKKIRQRIVELRQEAMMYRNRGPAYKREEYVQEARALEAERILNWFSEP
jgi:hypothetical protein